MQMALRLACIKPDYAPSFDQVNLKNVANEPDHINSSRNQHNSLSSQGSQPGKDFKTYAQVRRESKQRQQLQGSSSPRETQLIPYENEASYFSHDANQLYNDAVHDKLHSIEAELQKQREDSLRRNILVHIHQAQREFQSQPSKILAEVREQNTEQLESKRSPIHQNFQSSSQRKAQKEDTPEKLISEPSSSGKSAQTASIKLSLQDLASKVEMQEATDKKRTPV